MSEIVYTSTTISSLYAQLLSNAGLAPLEGGGIYFGRGFVEETRTPNSVVLVPIGGTFAGPKATASVDETAVPFTMGKVPDHADRIRARPLWTEYLDLECHFYCAATPGDAIQNIIVTELYYQLFIDACYQLASTQVQLKNFLWVSQQPGALSKVSAGEHFMMTITVIAPITDLSVNFIPPGTKARNIVQIGSSTP